LLPASVGGFYLHSYFQSNEKVNDDDDDDDARVVRCCDSVPVLPYGWIPDSIKSNNDQIAMVADSSRRISTSTTSKVSHVTTLASF